jgi:4-hydroxy-2-oxoheptanedioate aldolase
MTSLRQRISDGAPLIGMFSFLDSTASIEILGLTGFDFVIIDCQHGLTDPFGRSLAEQIRAARLAGISPIVRVVDNDRGQILKALDAGAEGIVVPQVSIVAEAQQAVNAAFYPPIGSRSACASAPAAGFGTSNWDEYYARAQDVLVFVLLEDLEAVRNATSIAAVPGVSGLFFGPSDMSVAMGLTIDTRTNELDEHRDLVYSAAKSQGLFVADLAWDASSATNFAERGADLLAFGIDTAVLRAGVSHIEQSVRGSLDQLRHANRSAAATPEY